MKKITILFILLLTSCFTELSHQVSLSNEYQAGDTYMQIRLRGTVRLVNKKINHLRLSELSGLAWSEDDKILYAISDDGNLFHLRPQIVDNTLVGVNFITAFTLSNKKGKKLKYRDSEGLSILNGANGIIGDSELIISFERKPRIARFNPKGKLLVNYTLPPVLKKKKFFYNNNKIFEAVTVHPKLGVITAPELPMRKNKIRPSLKNHKHTIYALDGKSWSFPAFPVKNSSIVAMEYLQDGSLLILERAYVSIYKPLIITLRQLWLETMETKQVAVFNNHLGWQIDNFEGLTHHQGNYFFMVSDNNDISLQRTLLTYFEFPVQNKI
ncbi:esterase-like activity of phytase family protein [Thiotrichales bacterium HSG1]|nr:esterase-like activity of phytase family protein [Thiotrichales bacterium HSG1]